MGALWPLALFIPLMFLAVMLVKPLRTAIEAWAGQYTDTPDEARQTAAEALKAELDQEVRKGAVEAETLARQAELRAQAARSEVDAEAARQCLPAAVEARQLALEARGRAEAEAAPELARAALNSSDGEVMRALKDAYSVFCQQYGYSSVPTFGTWISGFDYTTWKRNNT